MFGTPYFLINLMRSKNIFMDGTFKHCPEPFGQLFTIHSLLGKNDKRRVIPRLFCLLPSKDEQIYNWLFTRIFQVFHQMFPTEQCRWNNITLDFETGLLASLRELFVDHHNLVPHQVQLNGCHFHYCSLLYKYLISPQCNLKHQYDTLPAFKSLVRKLFSLPFLPPNEIVNTFNEINNPANGHIPQEVGNLPGFQHFMQYVSNEWVNNARKRLLANVYIRGIDCVARTNNDVEGWHNGIHTIMNNTKTLWRFIKGIKDVQSRQHFLHNKILSGSHITLRKKIYRIKEERLKEIRKLFDDGQYLNNIRYLNAVASAGMPVFEDN